MLEPSSTLEGRPYQSEPTVLQKAKMHLINTADGGVILPTVVLVCISNYTALSLMSSKPFYVSIKSKRNLTDHIIWKCTGLHNLLVNSVLFTFSTFG